MDPSTLLTYVERTADLLAWSNPNQSRLTVILPLLKYFSAKRKPKVTSIVNSIF